MPWAPLPALVFGMVLYGIGPVLAQASTISGTGFAFWRMIFGVGVLGLATLVAVAAGASRWPETWRAWKWAGISGIAFGAHQLLMFSAVKASSVADVTLIGTLTPIVVGLLAVRVFSERPTRAFIAWAGVAMIGAGAVALAGSQGPDGSPPGIVMAVLNAVAFGVFMICSKRGREDLDTMAFLFGVMVVATVVVVAGAQLTREPVMAHESSDLLLALAVAAGPGFMAHTAMTWAMKWVPANVPSVMRLSQPVFAGFLAWLLLGEMVTGAHLLGGALTIGGVAGAILTRERPAPPDPEVAATGA